MVFQVDQIAQDEYDTNVKAAYGQTGMLRNTVTRKTGIIGDREQFRLGGKNIARDHISGAVKTSGNTPITPVWCNLKALEAVEFVDKFDMQRANISLIREMGKINGNAISLAEDQMIINALENGYDAADRTVGDPAAALTVTTLRSAAKLLNKAAVQNSQRYFLHTAQQLDDLLGTTEVTSADFNTVRALVNGEVDSFMGFKFILIADRLEGGLPVAGSAGSRGFVYHTAAVGEALSQDIQSSIGWDESRGGWWLTSDIRGGAVVIDELGVVAVESSNG